MEGIRVKGWPGGGHQLDRQWAERRSWRLRDLLLLEGLRHCVSQTEERVRNLTGCGAGLVLVIEAEIFRFVFLNLQGWRSLIFEALLPVPHGC